MKRLQRLRATAALRDMVSEIGFGQSQLIQPLFLSEGAVKEEPIAGLPGTARHTLASLLIQFEKDLAAGVRQLIIWHPRAISALDPATGRIYWESPLNVGQGMTVPTPVK